MHRAHEDIENHASDIIHESNFTIIPNTINLIDSLDNLQTCENFSFEDNLSEHQQKQIIQQVLGNMKDTTHNQEVKQRNTDADEIIDRAKQFKPLKVYDKFRCPNAHKNGGFPLNDVETMNNLRSAVKGCIAQVGRTILSGQFNLATISFPIWCMAPRSIL